MSKKPPPLPARPSVAVPKPPAPAPAVSTSGSHESIPLTAHPFPDDSPSFWKDIERLKEEVQGFGQSVQQQLDGGLFLTKSQLRANTKKTSTLGSLLGMGSHSHSHLNVHPNTSTSSSGIFKRKPPPALSNPVPLGSQAASEMAGLARSGPSPSVAVSSAALQPKSRDAQEAADRQAFRNYKMFVMEHSQAGYSQSAASLPNGSLSAPSSPSHASMGSGGYGAVGGSLGRHGGQQVKAGISEGKGISIGGWEDLTDVMERINTYTNNMEDALQRWHDTNASTVAQVEGIHAKFSEYDEAKKAYVAKMKKYLGYSTVKDSGKFANADKKIRLKKQVLEMQRFDLDSALQHLNLSREMSVLRPLNQVVQAYWEFFQQGYALMAPLQKKMDELSAYVKQREESLGRELATLRETRRQWEKKIGAMKDVKEEKTTSGGGTGIRDLDGSRGKPTTSDREKEGYLFSPAPNFAMVWAALRNDKLTVQRPNGGELSVPVQLCTVKENRELKLRFVFSVISPSETILLQCDSQREMDEWLTVIQNAISFQLHHASSGSAPAAAMGSGKRGASPSVMDPPPSAADAERQLMLQELREVKGNNVCADCDTKDPEWVSLNLGIMICMECSGVHRSMGVHISKVRSSTLDKLDSFLLAYLKSIGNHNSNTIWEAGLTGEKRKIRPVASTPRPQREAFIRAKYCDKSFMGGKESDKSKLNLMLFEAIQADKALSVLKYISWGADTTWPNPAQEGRTALHQAVMWGNPTTLECIIQHSLSITTAEVRGWTVLHYAAYQDDPTLVEIIVLRGGAGLSIVKDKDGLTPLEVAIKHNIDETRAPKVQPVLESAQAKIEKTRR